MTRVLIINGSYRDDGITDQAVAVAIEALQQAGAKTEIVNLRDYPIEFCLNCRECTLNPGVEPGRCVLDDGMHELIEKIEAAEAFVLASPTNFGSVTAIFKRFMERLVAYAYWPWDKPWTRRWANGAASAATASCCRWTSRWPRWPWTCPAGPPSSSRPISGATASVNYRPRWCGTSSHRWPSRCAVRCT